MSMISINANIAMISNFKIFIVTDSKYSKKTLFVQAQKILNILVFFHLFLTF